MSWQHALGIAATGFEAVLLTIIFASTKYLTDHAWPVYRMEACACYINVAALIPLVIWGGQQLPASNQIGWVIGRGFCGACDFLCRVMSIWLGTSLGDVATLTSINMVFAAFLGRLFLQEDLTFEHIVAVCCSVSGAVLISKPEFLFHRSEPASNSWVGQALAILAGFFSASSCICGRKSTSAPLALVVLAVMLALGCSSMLVPYTFAVDDASLGKLIESPEETMAWLCWISLSFVVGTFAYSAGAAWCPAATTTTVSCSMSMFSGYVVQAVFFGQIPGTSTLVGTILMFSGVVLMTFARRPDESCISDNVADDIDGAVEQDSSDTVSVAESVATMDSIASFVAMEFAECAPRQRRLNLVRPLLGAMDMAGAVQGA